jgi:hypothetical protein
LRQPCAGAAPRRYDAGDRLFRLRPALTAARGRANFSGPSSSNRLISQSRVDRGQG